MSNDELIRLECIKTAHGDIIKARELYKFMTEKTSPKKKKA